MPNQLRKEEKFIKESVLNKCLKVVSAITDAKNVAGFSQVNFYIP